VDVQVPMYNISIIVVVYVNAEGYIAVAGEDELFAISISRFLIRVGSGLKLSVWQPNDY